MVATQRPATPAEEAPQAATVRAYPLPPVEDEQLKAKAEKRRVERIEAAKAELEPGTVEGKEDAPVYDKRGNVRPRGTPGTRPMTYGERVKIAQRLAKG